MTGSQHDGGASRRPPVLPAVIALVDAVLLLLAVGVWAAGRVPFTDLVDAYLLGDAAIGAGFALGGALITARSRRNVVGWLMLTGGSLYLVATAVGSLLYLRLADGDGGPTTRVLAAVFSTVWMPAIAVLFSLALQLFPTGRPVNRFGAVWLGATAVGGVAVTVSWVLDPHLLAGMGLDGPEALLRGGPPGWLSGVLTALQPLGVAAVSGALLVPLFRLVRRPGDERLQVLWLVWAAVVVLVVNAPTALADVPPPIPLLSIPLIPLAMTAAVLRYRLYGITLVINRTLVYLALTVTLLAGYLAVVYGLSAAIRPGGLRQVLATGVVALAFSPLRSRLQRLVDRLMFGPGSDPYGTLADLGRRLQSPTTPDQVLPEIATTVADALRLPYVLVRAGRPGAPPVAVVEHGTAPAGTTTFPLQHQGQEVGALTVSNPPRQRLLGTPRGGLLADLVGQLGPAVSSVVLAEELAASRQRTIAALEEERTRIRRDLHDGLGPVLTGVALKTEAARNLVGDDPAAARQLMADVTTETHAVIDDVRRLVYGLRPPTLDRHDLTSALSGWVDRLGGAGNGGPALRLELPTRLPSLDPAVEVAAYRIVTEALANVVRHSGATAALARVWVDDGSLHLAVEDDGASDGGWVAGVGLTSMRERTEQLGGGFAATGSDHGGTVTAWLPLGAR